MGSNPVTQQDSPLSITSNVAGLLSFIIAIAAAILVRLSYLRSADTEYFQVKQSLNWYKTESTWMTELITSRIHQKQNNASIPPSQTNHNNGNQENKKEHEMYTFILDQLIQLERRLLELLTEVETEANKAENKVEVGGESKGNWTLVQIPRRYSLNTSIAVAWLPARTKALELVRQREALGPRVLFAQLSMVGSRLQTQELHHTTQIAHLETIISSQHEKLDKLQDLVYRLPRPLYRRKANSKGDYDIRNEISLD